MTSLGARKASWDDGRVQMSIESGLVPEPAEAGRREVLGEHGRQGYRVVHALDWDNPFRRSVVMGGQGFPRAACGHVFWWRPHLTKLPVSCKNCEKVLAARARRAAEAKEEGDGGVQVPPLQEGIRDVAVAPAPHPAGPQGQAGG